MRKKNSCSRRRTGRTCEQRWSRVVLLLTVYRWDYICIDRNHSSVQSQKNFVSYRLFCNACVFWRISVVGLKFSMFRLCLKQCLVKLQKQKPQQFWELMHKIIFSFNTVCSSSLYMKKQEAKNQCPSHCDRGGTSSLPQLFLLRQQREHDELGYWAQYLPLYGEAWMMQKWQKNLPSSFLLGLCCSRRGRAWGTRGLSACLNNSLSPEQLRAGYSSLHCVIPRPKMGNLSVPLCELAASSYFYVGPATTNITI